MTHSAGLSTKFSAVALVCVGAILLAWAAPVLVFSGDMSDFLQRSQDHQANDPAEVEDTSDDPVMIVSNGNTGPRLLTCALRACQLSAGLWSPLSPARPPNLLNFI
jgi:hypothetical protein